MEQKLTDRYVIDRVYGLVKKHFGNRIDGAGYAYGYKRQVRTITINGTKRTNRPIMNIKAVQDFFRELKEQFDVHFEDNSGWRGISKNHTASDIYTIELSRGKIRIYVDMNGNDWIQLSVEGSASLEDYFTTITNELKICSSEQAKYKRQADISKEYFGIDDSNREKFEKYAKKIVGF